MRVTALSLGLVLALLTVLAACAPGGRQSAAPTGSTPGTGSGAPAPGAASAARGVESFYRGKTLRIIVGSAPGGGYDTYARTIARHMTKHIPGHPNIIVENMPGAGSLIAANHVYRVAPKDGTVLAHPQGGIFLQQLFGQQGVEFDSLRWQVVGMPASDNNLCVATRASGVKSLAELMGPGGKSLVVGGNAPGSATWDVPMRLKTALDLNLRVIEGYDGTAKVRLAMDSAEVDGLCGWGWESLQATALDRVENGDYAVIVQVTEQPLKELPNVPTALQLARTEEARQLIRLGIIIPNKILRPFLLAPEVPAERVQALREAFETTMTDPEFRVDAERAKVEIGPIPGEEVQRLIRELFGMPEDLKTRLKQINNREG